MSRLEYTAECLCGGLIICTFKKPTRMQHTVAKSQCSACRSEFLFSCQVGMNEKGRYYFTDHTVENMTEMLRDKAKEKYSRPKSGDKIIEVVAPEMPVTPKKEVSEKMNKLQKNFNDSRINFAEKMVKP